MIEEGPFLNTLNTTEGVFRKTVINYKIRNGQLIMESATRTFHGDDDYNDTTEVVPMCKVGE